MQEYKVWDAPTRWFHWINFTSVLLLLLTGFLFMYRKQLAIDSRDSKFLIMALHSWIGYVFAVNLVWRLIWGFFGNRYARWRALLPTWRSLLALASDLRALCQRQPYQYVGRSPMSRLAVTVMFLLLLGQAGTGFIRSGIDLYELPLGPIFASYLAKPGVDPSELSWRNAAELIDADKYKVIRPYKFLTGTIHSYTTYVIIAAILLHIAGVTLTEVRQRSGAVSAMLSGRRVLTTPPLDAEDSVSDEVAEPGGGAGSRRTLMAVGPSPLVSMLARPVS
jgi:cytochrome b